jgi:NTE family protein
MRWLCLLLFSFELLAQQTPYQNLVLEGGGIRGIAYCGAIEVLERKGILENVKRVGGTSAGAIQASLLAVGYRADELTQIVKDMKVESFNDGQYVFFGGTKRLLKRYGWYKGDKFRKWIEQKIEHKTQIHHLTFGRLHELSKTQPSYRDLYITATNLSKQKAVVFSYENYPEMRIADAVRISMSIPLYYCAVLVDSLGHIYDKQPAHIEVDVMVDGGILMNYPIHLFDQEKYIKASDSFDSFSEGNTKIFNNQTIGLRLERSEQIEFDRNSSDLAPFKINGMSEYVSAFYNILLENANRKNFTKADIARTISIDFKNTSPRVRKLSITEKETLINAGREAADTFFKKL